MVFLVNIASVLLTSTSLITSGGVSTSSSNPMTDLPTEKIYTLSAISEQSPAEFVVETEVPNSCFDLSRPSVRVNHERNVILFHLEARQINTRGCSDQPLSALSVIHLGKLSAGHYDILELKSLKKRGELEIQKQNPSAVQDDTRFAEISSAMVHQDVLGYRRLLTLTGFFNNSCSTFGTATSSVRQTSSTVIEVLPEIHKKSMTSCELGRIPFIRTFEIPDSIESGRYLIHVFAANGRYIDRIASVETGIEKTQTVVWNQDSSPQ